MVLQDILESSQAVLFRFSGTCPETRKVLKSGNSEKCHTSRVSGVYSTQVKWEIKPLNAFNTGNMIPISWKKKPTTPQQSSTSNSIFCSTESYISFANMASEQLPVLPKQCVYHLSSICFVLLQRSMDRGVSSFCLVTKGFLFHLLHTGYYTLLRGEWGARIHDCL